MADSPEDPRKPSPRDSAGAAPVSDSESGGEREEGGLFTTTISLALLVFAVFAFKDFVLDANNIPSGSMIPTLKVGDYLFVNKMRYSLRIPFTDVELFRIDDPQRGDIVTFVPPYEEDKHYVKRVMAVPGDRIRIRDVSACQLQAYLDERAAEARAADARSAEERSEARKRELSEEGADAGALLAREDGSVRTELRPAADATPAGSEPANEPGNEPLERDYSCDEGRRGLGPPPVIAVVEYRAGDAGPWRNYSLEELPARAARELLRDADEPDVLHPDYRSEESLYSRGRLPVVLEEQVGAHAHRIVEGAARGSLGGSALCSELEDGGCIVPDGAYLVMGDNRDNSRDSRMIGYISRDKILGKALIIYFSINWYDQVCREYARYAETAGHADAAFPLPDFPPEEQLAYCSEKDIPGSFGEAGSPAARISDYLWHTVSRRIPRMDVRWSRIGMLLE